MESVSSRLCVISNKFTLPVGSVRTHTVTTNTIAANVNRQENRQKICHMISSLHNIHFNFNKIQFVHKKKLRYLQNLLRKKNETIAGLAKKLESAQKKTTHKPTHWKYFGVVRCKNTIRTIIGNEKFVRRRLVELCTLFKAEYVFCQARADGDKDRQTLANLMTATFGSRVIVYENNRRFEFNDPEEIASAKRLIIKHLQNESQSHINAY
ncbi:Mv-ORF8 peptide [Maruca vitrata nucleopolyhedrovirus]|uniref:Mv-ORF8 peptide n=1 Tax=Maruca vitrata nucleopolyhedrovirus TaxID=1307954 RepID=A1YR70_9ABAC|nr:Mv-ORF8 peptide [Maruca vitrata nucleopolyhedrovirus]ABL75960.1 Mv-ORF8 peptide [Maruca vitrata nucleopolyhedrovirus]